MWIVSECINGMQGNVCATMNGGKAKYKEGKNYKYIAHSHTYVDTLHLINNLEFLSFSS